MTNRHFVVAAVSGGLGRPRPPLRLVSIGDGELRYVVGPMGVQDIDEVTEIEKQAFSSAWSSSAYRRELTENKIARYIVLRELSDPGTEIAADQVPPNGGARPTGSPPGPTQSPKPTIWRLLAGLLRQRGNPPLPVVGQGRIVGFAGMWLMVDEAHLTTIAVRPEYRGRGFGELLLVKALEIAKQLNARVMTLEVRVSNSLAQALYKKYGFQIVGTRRRYYTDNNEDAFIMTSETISSPEFAARFETLKAANARRTDAENC